MEGRDVLQTRAHILTPPPAISERLGTSLDAQPWFPHL